MAKVSAVQKDLKRRRLVKRYAARRAALNAIIYDKNIAPEERFRATLKLSKLPRDSSKTRVRNRCALSGRPRAHHRKFCLSRIAVRDLAARGELPGITKSSW